LKNDLLYISSSAINSHNIIESIKVILSITNNIELSGGSDFNENLLEELIELKNKYKLNYLVHNYFPPPKEHILLNFAKDDDQTKQFIHKSVLFVKLFNLNYYSIHSGFKKEFKKDGELLFETLTNKNYNLENLENNVNWFFINFPEISLALENMYPNNNDLKCGFMMHIDEIDLILKKLSNIYLLLDFGHLWISSIIMKFDFQNSIEFLFKEYGHRIIEIHLSENNGFEDSHSVITSNGMQYNILKKYIEIIKKNKIFLSIEIRNSSLKKLTSSYNLINKLLN
jgi:sugar phosphate isomerase/epimerase